jgi:hypothetical protein
LHPTTDDTGAVEPVTTERVLWRSAQGREFALEFPIVLGSALQAE